MGKNVDYIFGLLSDHAFEGSFKRVTSFLPISVPTVHMATTSSSSRQRPEARAMAEAARTMKVFMMMWRII